MKTSVRNNLIRVASGEKQADLVLKNVDYLNVFTGEIMRGDIAIADGYIAGIGEYDGKTTYHTDGLVVPGFIDGHIHIESSMATPNSFAEEAIKHGTTTVICDPHEIANVAGEYGIEFMLESSRDLAVDFKFMLPSCVPATNADENYGTLDFARLKRFYGDDGVIGLGEVMDVSSVLNVNPDMMKKIGYALKKGYVVNGHAPMVSGKTLCAYIAAGITDDHESTTPAEALNKLRLGQFVMIRQGTAAKNLDLVPLLDKYYGRCMFVTDDMHPEDLLNKGHIDGIISDAISLGADKIKAIISATLTPATYYGLNDRGAISPGRRADLAVLDGTKVIDVFSYNALCDKRGHDTEWNFAPFGSVKFDGLDCGKREVIGLVKGQILTTDCGFADGTDKNGDIVKLFAAERHHGTGHNAACYLHGYGIKKGAVATSISHDSHNIIAAGYDDDIVAAVNALVSAGGGIAVSCGDEVKVLPLEIGGIMSKKSIPILAKELDELKKFAFRLGVSEDIDPFMTLSFLSLAVIPSVRLLPTGVVKI